MDEKTRMLKQQIAAIKDEAFQIKNEASKIYDKISVLEKTIGEEEELSTPKKKTMQKVPLSGI